MILYIFPIFYKYVYEYVYEYVYVYDITPLDI